MCPRRCGADRRTGAGYCGCGDGAAVAKTMLHIWEEPPVSGTRGSGAVFFSGCNLRCIYCQNRDISFSVAGRRMSRGELADAFLSLRDAGAHNINLVTGSHFVRPIAEALDGLELGIPVVWNSSGYESVESLRRLEGLVQVYMPDYKYSGSVPAARYSNAPDYPRTAAAAIKEMYRQVGPFRLDDDEMLQSGVLIRHLILPGWTDNSIGCIDWVAENFPPHSVLFSLMSQYTPMPGIEQRFPELARTVDGTIAQMLYEYLLDKGIEDGYYQEPDASGEDMIPAWDLSGCF